MFACVEDVAGTIAAVVRFVLISVLVPEINVVDGTGSSFGLGEEAILR